jgi:hypothetical protein
MQISPYYRAQATSFFYIFLHNSKKSSTFVPKLQILKHNEKNTTIFATITVIDRLGATQGLGAV